MIKKIVALLKDDSLLFKTLSATIVFYFYKTAFWPLTYLFVSSYILLAVLVVFKFGWDFKVRKFISTFFPPFALAFIMILAFIFNSGTNTTIFKDFFRLLILFSLFYFLYLSDTLILHNYSRIYIVNFILILTSIICIINLLYLSFPNFIPVEFALRLRLSDGATIANDYNFFTLFILFGLIILNYPKNYINESCVSNSNYRLALNILFVFNILFSSSRRGLIVFLLLLTFTLVLKFKKLLKSKKLYLFSSIVKTFIPIVTISLISGFAIFKIIPKQKLSVIAYRYSTLLGFDNYSKIEKFLWKKDPKVPSKKELLIDASSFEPKRGFWEAASPGTTLTYISTPYGPGIRLTKIGDPISFSLHYVGPNILYYAEHTYKISFKIRFIKGDFNSFYLGWWTDDGGKGYSNTLVLSKKIERIDDEWFNCSAEYTFIDNHAGLVGFINTVANNTEFVISDFKLIDQNFNPSFPRYEFEYEGGKEIASWMDEINSPWNDLNLINNGDFTHGLAFWNYTANELSIDVREFNNKKCALISRGNGNGSDWSLIYNGRNLEFYAHDEYQLSFKFKSLTSKNVPFNIGYWVDEGDGYKIALNQEIVPSDSGWLQVKARYRFKKNYGNIIFPINSQLSNTSFYITDIELINISKTQYQIEPLSRNIDKLIENTANRIDTGRASRIQYAKELWNSKYTLINKFFGHGYNFYDWYLIKYPNTIAKADYPHNPFITILLYSGIFGLMAYFWLLYRTVLLYLKNTSAYEIFFIFFLITFFFSFFSAGSPFDPPIMGFFILLPYFINHLENI